MLSLTGSNWSTDSIENIEFAGSIFASTYCILKERRLLILQGSAGTSGRSSELTSPWLPA